MDFPLVNYCSPSYLNKNTKPPLVNIFHYQNYFHFKAGNVAGHYYILYNISSYGQVRTLSNHSLYSEA